MARSILSVGVVGAGEIGTKVHLPVLLACKAIRIAYVADRNKDRAALAAKFANANAIILGNDVGELPHTDVVLIATPVGTREVFYKLFADRGTSVLAEKPVAATEAAARQASSLFKSSEFAVCLQRRTFASSEIARRVLAENWFGPLLGISIEEGARGGKTGTDERFYDSRSLSPGGILLDLGTHALDLAFNLTGASRFEVVDSEMLIDGHVDRESRGRFTLEAQSPIPCRYNFSWLRQASNTITFEFAACSLEVGSSASAPSLLRSATSTNSIQLQQPEKFATSVYQAFYLIWAEFLASVRAGNPTSFSAASSLPVVSLIEKLYARAGVPIG